MTPKKVTAMAFAVLALLFAAFLVSCGASVSLPDNQTGENNGGQIPKIAWWDDYPRFTNIASNVDLMDYVNANVATTTVGLSDEGRTRLLKDAEYNKSMIETMSWLGIKPGGWLEAIGTIDCIIGAFHRLEDGSFEIDPKTGATKIYAHNWTWDAAGPGVNKNANTVMWMALDTYVNRNPVYGRYLDDMDIPEPKYPDGRSALGYFNDDPSDPRNAKLYDAMCGKDINGNLTYNLGLTDSQNTAYKIHYVKDGKDIYAGSMGFYKDPGAAEWWMHYYREAFTDLIKRGARFFWIDNYNGFDTAYETIRLGFGDYSVYGFRDYLKKHPEIGVANPENFDVRVYLKDLFSRHFPDLDPSDIYNDAVKSAWCSEVFLDDPVWMAYLAYKADLCQNFARLYYKTIKDAAKQCGVDPDEVGVGCNDVGRLSLGGLTGDECDLVHTEYTEIYSLYTSFKADGLPPLGGSGTFYKVISNHFKSRNGVVWYYMDGEHNKYKNNYELALVTGFEGLANDTMMNGGDENDNILGTNKSLRFLNGAIKKLTPVLSGRRRAGDIALLYSYESFASYMAPGGISYRMEVQTGFDFYGWGHALEELNIPYDVVYDFRLEKGCLKNVKLLILPSVVSISDAQIDMLVKYVQGGGNVIISGENSGERLDRAGAYQKRGSPRLSDEMKKLESTGRVMIFDYITAEEYLSAMLKDPDYANLLLPKFKAAIDRFASNGVAPEYIVTDVQGKVRTSLHYNEYTKRMSIDVVNVNIDVESDTLTDCGGVKLLVRPLAAMGKTEKLKAFAYGVDGQATELTVKPAKDGYFEIEVPAFRYYVSAVIE